MYTLWHKSYLLSVSISGPNYTTWCSSIHSEFPFLHIPAIRSLSICCPARAALGPSMDCSAHLLLGDSSELHLCWTTPLLHKLRAARWRWTKLISSVGHYLRHRIAINRANVSPIALMARSLRLVSTARQTHGRTEQKGLKWMAMLASKS